MAFENSFPGSSDKTLYSITNIYYRESMIVCVKRLFIPVFLMVLGAPNSLFASDFCQLEPPRVTPEMIQDFRATTSHHIQPGQTYPYQAQDYYYLELQNGDTEVAQTPKLFFLIFKEQLNFLDQYAITRTWKTPADFLWGIMGDRSIEFYRNVFKESLQRYFIPHQVLIDAYDFDPFKGYHLNQKNRHHHSKIENEVFLDGALRYRIESQEKFNQVMNAFRTLFVVHAYEGNLEALDNEVQRALLTWQRYPQFQTTHYGAEENWPWLQRHLRLYTHFVCQMKQFVEIDWDTRFQTAFMDEINHLIGNFDRFLGIGRQNLNFNSDFGIDRNQLQVIRNSAQAMLDSDFARNGTSGGYANRRLRVQIIRNFAEHWLEGPPKLPGWNEEPIFDRRSKTRFLLNGIRRRMGAPWYIANIDFLTVSDWLGNSYHTGNLSRDLRFARNRMYAISSMEMRRPEDLSAWAKNLQEIVENDPTHPLGRPPHYDRTFANLGKDDQIDILSRIATHPSYVIQSHYGFMWFLRHHHWFRLGDAY